jgi:hypothetical protein
LASLDLREAEMEAAWNDEIRRRVDEVDRDAVELTPASEAFAQVRRAHGR